jgi:hypothetical protein
MDDLLSSQDDSSQDGYELEFGGDNSLLSTGELYQTPIEPKELVLNPGGEETDKNPLCPHCEEPIEPVVGDAERRFVCGCETNWMFKFD